MLHQYVVLVTFWQCFLTKVTFQTLMEFCIINFKKTRERNGKKMKKSKLIVLIMIVFSLSLGGCSFFNGQSAKKQENQLEYNPMGGMNVYLEVNNDEKLTIDTTVHMEDSGEFEAGSYGISAELSRLLRGDEYGK